MKRGVLPLLLVAAALAAAGCGARTGPAGGEGTAATTASLARGGGPATATTGDDPGATAGSATGDNPAVKAGSATARFRGGIATGRTTIRKRLRHSWRPGCPVGPVELRLLQVDHWGFDRRVHRGELVVHRDHARRILRVLQKLFEARHPVQRLRLVDHYMADDDRSMAANNTSGFNCRPVAGTDRWSEHAYGRAVDLNPLRNPYVTRSGRVSPPAGRPYANRGRSAAGMIHDGDTVVRAFAAAGWKWGGRWSGARDYQHFSATGR